MTSKLECNETITENDINFLKGLWSFVDTDSKKRLDKIIIKLYNLEQSLEAYNRASNTLNQLMKLQSQYGLQIEGEDQRDLLSYIITGDVNKEYNKLLISTSRGNGLHD